MYINRLSIEYSSCTQNENKTGLRFPLETKINPDMVYYIDRRHISVYGRIYEMSQEQAKSEFQKKKEAEG